MAALGLGGGGLSPDDLALALTPDAGAGAVLPPAPPLPGVEPMPAEMAAPQFPTTNPDVMGQVLGEIIAMQQQDQQSLQMQQNQALAANPLFEALVSGAPMAPGAGAPAGGIGAGAPVAPDPAMMALFG